MNAMKYSTLLTLTLLGLGALVLAPQPAAAQDAEVVNRLMQYGRMEQRDARALTEKISAVLQRDAAAGGERYNPLRQAVNRAVFGRGAGPGGTRVEYDQRLAQVLSRMRGGLDGPILSVLFRPARNAAALCSNNFGVTMGECDALISAASSQAATLPYMPPDDGAALGRALRQARVSRRQANEVVRKLLEVMLGVPRILTRDDRGRGLLSLLAACPGGTPDREAQIRAWHVGPTEGMARCLAAQVAAGGPARAELLFGMSPAAAQAWLRWGAPGVSAAAPPPVNPAPPPVNPAPPPVNPRVAPPRPTPPLHGAAAAEALREQARSFFRARRYPQAAAAYEAAATIQPNHAGTQSGLGACRLAMGDPAGAAAAYGQAVRLAPDNGAFRVAQARALVAAGDRDGAIAALQQALVADPNNTAAQHGLSALGGHPLPPPLPETPPREVIVGVMQTLTGALRGCAPEFDGVATFRLSIEGATGDVTEATLQGDAAETDEGQCMAGVVQSAHFPRFTRESITINYPFQLHPLP